MAIEILKGKHGLSPPFMQEILIHKDNEKGTRSGDTFERPKVDSVKKGDRSLRSFGPIVWNEMLPNKLKECETLTEFKNCVKNWTPDNCRCELCKTYVGGLGYTNVIG